MRIEDRAIGSVLKRSMTPSFMSVATATATLADAKSVDCAKSPDIGSEW